MKRLLYLGPSGIGDWCFIYPSLAALLTENHAEQADLILPYQNDGNELLKKNELINNIQYLHRETKGLNIFSYAFRWLKLLHFIRKQRYDTVSISYLSNQPDMLLFALFSGAKKRIGIRKKNNWLQRMAINSPVSATREYNRVAQHQSYISQNTLPLPLNPLVPPIGPDQLQALLDKYKIPMSYIILGVGGGRDSAWRFWPAESFSQLIQLGHEHQWVLMGGGEEDLQQAKIILQKTQGLSVYNLVNQTSMSEACALISRAQAVVGNDSGIANLSALMNVPTLCLYGPTSAELTGPALNGAIPLQTSLPCQPCFGEPNNPSIAIQCHHRNCLGQLSSESVYEVLKSNMIHREFRSKE